MEVKSTWGDNPYHQVHEYTMSVMHLVQRSSWQLPVFGVIVFPDDADTSRLTERIGKFYRVTSLSKLVTVLEQVIVECRRNDPYAKRPTVEQVENIIRGKSL
jgi:hypothetical protein